MASEHEKLVEDLARKIGKVVMSISPEESWTEPAARAAIALIAERTKEATDEMSEAGHRAQNKIECYPEHYWFAMHAASALWPSHGTDGIEEKAK